MHTLTREALIKILEKLGLKQADGLLVHSAVQFLGKPVDGLETYTEAILEVIGPQGTLAAPTFNFGFCRGEVFDPDTTPSIDMGVFSEYIRQLPDSIRTKHPMQSLAVLGKDADEFFAIDTRSAFDDGSVFDEMIKREFKLLLLGANIQAASLVHWSEQRQEVPYRHWKSFSGSVLRDGREMEAEYSMFVRDLDLDPVLDLDPIQERLEEMNAWREEPLGYGIVASCRMGDFCQAADALLHSDSWALIANKPEPGTPLEHLEREA